MNLRSLDESVVPGTGTAALAALVVDGVPVTGAGVACWPYVPAAQTASGIPAAIPNEKSVPASNDFLKAWADMMATSGSEWKQRELPRRIILGNAIAREFPKLSHRPTTLPTLGVAAVGDQECRVGICPTSWSQ
jgi:hypothetical protein